MDIVKEDTNMGGGGHRPGLLYDTYCITTIEDNAILSCKGVLITADNKDGYYKTGGRYVWAVVPAADYNPPSQVSSPATDPTPSS
jgi:hypothetical protein